MADEKQTTENTEKNAQDVAATDAATETAAPKEEAKVAEPAAAAKDAKEAPKADKGGRPKRNFTKNKRRPSRKRRERVKPEFDSKILSLRRVTRVMAGGRRFSFSVAIVAGDKKGRVGFGLGKAMDVSLAIEKAMRNAKKTMITLPFTDTGSIAHEVDAKYGSSQVFIYPAPGKGLTAGSAVRTVLELGGAKDVGAKVRSRSKNQINIARATLDALSSLRA